jgi:hypothetical protein
MVLALEELPEISDLVALLAPPVNPIFAAPEVSA